MIRHLARVATTFIAAAFLAISASAQEVGPPPAPDSKGPQPPFTAWNGSFTQQIPIEIPAFRGLEPRLSLSYDSARGSRSGSGPGGIVGVGWSVNGLSVIERVSGSDTRPPETPSGPVYPDKKTGGRGVPAYGSSGMPDDSFTLDGDELIACAEVHNASTVTPSCMVPALAGETKLHGARRKLPAHPPELRPPTPGRLRPVTAPNISIPRWKEPPPPRPSAGISLRSPIFTATMSITPGAAMQLSNAPSTPSPTRTAAHQLPILAEIKFYTTNRPDPVTYATGKDIRKVYAPAQDHRDQEPRRHGPEAAARLQFCL